MPTLGYREMAPRYASRETAANAALSNRSDLYRECTYAERGVNGVGCRGQPVGTICRTPLT